VTGFPSGLKVGLWQLLTGAFGCWTGWFLGDISLQPEDLCQVVALLGAVVVTQIFR
jgi:hypothetical protein